MKILMSIILFFLLFIVVVIFMIGTFITIGTIQTKLFVPEEYLMWGDFYYIIKLADGTKIDLAEVGGVRNNEHEFFVIKELDDKFVKMNVPKESSMDNFKYITEHLDKRYTDKVRDILDNVE